MSGNGLCYFKSFGGCGGRMDPGHLIPHQRLKRAGLDHDECWDRRVWRPMCRTHHHLFDYAKKIRLKEDQYPTSVREYAAEHGFFFAGPEKGWIKGAG